MHHYPDPQNNTELRGSGLASFLVGLRENRRCGGSSGHHAQSGELFSHNATEHCPDSPQLDIAALETRRVPPVRNSELRRFADQLAAFFSGSPQPT